MPLIRAWLRLWDGEVEAARYAPLRIGVGLLMALSLLSAARHAVLSFDVERGLPVSLVGGTFGGLHLPLLDGLTGPGVPLVLGLGVLLALLFAAGLAPRATGAALYLLHLSLQHRNAAWMDGSDALLRCLLFFLLLAPLGRRAGPVPAWPLYLCRLQVAVMYAATVVWKSLGSDWERGTALYYALSDARYQRFPMDWLTASAWGQDLLAVATWGTLLVEAAIPVLVWPRRTRPYALAAGVALHLGILLFMRIGLFSPVVLVSYLSFVQWPRRRP